MNVAADEAGGCLRTCRQTQRPEGRQRHRGRGQVIPDFGVYKAAPRVTSAHYCDMGKHLLSWYSMAPNLFAHYDLGLLL